MSTHAAPPPPAEPKSPMWLPALGAALFVAVALWWIMSPSPTPIAAEPETTEAGEKAAPPSSATPPQPSAAVSGDPSIKVDENIQKMLEDMKQRRREQGKPY